MPSVSIRQSSTPCQIGVSEREQLEPERQLRDGKNVPENRNIGTITKRKIGGKVASFSTRAASAAIGIEKAVPTSDRDRDGEDAPARRRRRRTRRSTTR